MRYLGVHEIHVGKNGRFYPIVTNLEDEIVLRGQASDTSWDASGSMHLTYGIERFYIAEATDHPNGKLTVQAVVTPSRDAMIKEVLLNGKPYAGTLESLAHKEN